MDATGVYEDNSRSSITKDSDWTSSDTAVATVSSSGLVTGVSIGTSAISAYDLGYSDSTTVTVTDSNLASISVTPSSATIDAGQSQQFTATGLLQSGHTVDLTNAVTWSSSDTAVATIDSNGLAVGASVKSLSTTDITAHSGSITSNVVTLTVE
jgi:carbohydrate-selective porin OprB